MTTETDRLKQAEKSKSHEWDTDFDRSTEEIKAEQQSYAPNRSCRKGYNPLMGIALMLLFIGIFSGGGHLVGFWWIWLFMIPMFMSCGRPRHHHSRIRHH